MAYVFQKQWLHNPKYLIFLFFYILINAIGLKNSRSILDYISLFYTSNISFEVKYSEIKLKRCVENVTRQ